jgi:acetyl/propionyl-CoA carboxylase alpha subunit
VERQFDRIAIVDRGEAAMRLLHAVRELNRERGLRLETLALHTDADRDARFVREADDAVAIGPATSVDHRRLERALVEGRAEAAWAGWGPLAGDPELAELCRRLGVAVIGPDPEALRRLAGEPDAGPLAEAAGVPAAPWSGGPVPGARRLEVQVLADHHGTVWALGVRDASIRRRQRTLLAESGGAARGARPDRERREAAVRLCLAAGYRDAGTVEFLYDPRRRAFADQAALRARLDELTLQVRNQKLGEVAEEFDRVHSVQRARQVGSVDRIIPAAALRPYLVDAVERGMRRTLERRPACSR